jgi:hypothetical protein
MHLHKLLHLSVPTEIGDPDERKKADREARRYLQQEQREEKRRANARKQQKRDAVKAKRSGSEKQPEKLDAATAATGEEPSGKRGWGAVDLMLNASGSEERWLVTQDRVSVNGGKSSKSPLRMIVGSGTDGGVSRYAVSITRVERGPKLDN